ncbi:MAG: FG-GAP-like repeat-containing protein [Crocinitomicaceae bacterium]|nr:FG-GAP-like repeat-containing protein [Crocinitomicaceae bacterium]
MRIIILSVLIIVLPNCVLAQFKFAFNNNIPVKVLGEKIDFPWAGGLNYVQISEIDYNFDGEIDLFVFDRSKDNIRIFETVIENGVKSYKYVYNAARFFPADVKYRAALVDYDGDGKNDLFTYGVGGVKVYKNIGNAIDGLQWQLISELLYSQYLGGTTNLYISSSDIPAYIDVDKDGDLDILTFHISGQRMEYHQNQSIEMYGHADSLIFILKNECWGKFTEGLTDNTVILNNPVSPCGIPNITNPLRPENEEEILEDEIENPTRHSGSTTLAFDIDNSGVLDLVIGDVDYDGLILLINGGTGVNTNSAMISQDPLFPSNSVQAMLSYFPASFFVDVDLDGIKDLIVSPNEKGTSENEKSVMYYKNTGTNTLPVFEYQSHDFLQNQMIENGTGAIPIFFDATGDGKEDLLVSTLYRYNSAMQRESGIQLYTQTGTNTAPEFTHTERDYLNLSAQNLGLRIVPTFGDLDGDGDQDMLIGKADGKIAYYQNTANANSPATFASPIMDVKDNLNQVINAGAFSFPQLFDLNEDGKLDLIIGRKTGQILYYENIGTTNSPSFKLITNKLGNVDISAVTPEGYASPHFFRWNDTIHLFVGGFDGKLHAYKNIENNLAHGDSFELVSHAYLGVNVDGYSSFWANDIDQDGNLNLFVGGDLGGLMHFVHDPNLILNVDKVNKNEPKINVYPNPNNGKFQIDASEGQLSDWEILVYDYAGRNVPFESTGKSIELLNHLAGFYFLKMTHKTTSKQLIKKLIIQ